MTTSTTATAPASHLVIEDDGGRRRDDRGAVGGHLRRRCRGAAVQPCDLGSDVRDRGQDPRREHHPQCGRQASVTVVGEHDHRGHRADADGSSELGDEAAAPRPHVEPELHHDERRGDGRRHPERGVGQDDGPADEHGEHGHLDRGHAPREHRAGERPSAVPVDQGELERRPGHEGGHRGGGQASAGPARCHRQPQEAGLERETPPPVLGRAARPTGSAGRDVATARARRGAHRDGPGARLESRVRESSLSSRIRAADHGVWSAHGPPPAQARSSITHCPLSVGPSIVSMISSTLTRRGSATSV